MSDLLAVVEDAARGVDEAQLHLRASVFQAAEAGVPISHIADAAGVQRPTIYRWIEAHRDGEEHSPTVEVGPALSAGIMALRHAVPHGTAAEITKRAQDRSTWMRIQSLRLGLKNVQSEDVWRDLTAQETGAIHLATAVAVAAEEYRERAGRWPTRVTLPGE